MRCLNMSCITCAVVLQRWERQETKWEQEAHPRTMVSCILHLLFEHINLLWGPSKKIVFESSGGFSLGFGCLFYKQDKMLGFRLWEKQGVGPNFTFIVHMLTSSGLKLAGTTIGLCFFPSEHNLDLLLMVIMSVVFAQKQLHPKLPKKLSYSTKTRGKKQGIHEWQH